MPMLMRVWYLLADGFMMVQVSIAKQLKSILGIEDSTKIGFLVHVSIFTC